MTKQPVVLITGTSKGIGLYLARHYLEKGYKVAGCSRGESTIDHPDYWHRSLDVGDETKVAGMVRECAEKFGRIDALLNNAGIASMNAALLTPGATMESVFRTNCFGAFYFAREAAKIMLKRKSGRIVFFTTVARPLATEGEIAYVASKAAVESISKILSKELAPSGITVTGKHQDLHNRVRTQSRLKNPNLVIDQLNRAQFREMCPEGDTHSMVKGPHRSS